MKKIPIIITVLIFILSAAAYGEYKVETEDDEYVSDAVFFAPASTWDKVEAQVVNLKKGKIIFYAGRENKPEKIETTVMPVNTTDKRVSFKSQDISIAAVDENGVVTPTGKEGDTVIEIICGKAKSRMKVRVVRGVEGVVMSQSALTLYADKPAAAQLEAIIAPEDATIKDVTWESADESIAYVDEDGLVYPCGVGETEVYATTEDGGYRTSCAVTVTTWEKRAGDMPAEYTEYDMTVEEMAEKQMEASPTVFTTDAYPASEEDVIYYVNPENLCSGYEKYQFLNLASSSGVSYEMLDAYLGGKGVLSGHGKAFQSAAEANGINEVYLVIHACLESGNGASQLARGTEINGVTVYNLFGIGAVDSDPVGGGAKFAYEQGWTSVEKAIEGGAEWISDNFINNMRYRQNTLYKMRWNPESPANHQYATDIEWASKQAKNMSAMFEAFPSAEYKFDIPVYEGQERAELE